MKAETASEVPFISSIPQTTDDAKPNKMNQPFSRPLEKSFISGCSLLIFLRWDWFRWAWHWPSCDLPCTLPVSGFPRALHGHTRGLCQGGALSIRMSVAGQQVFIPQAVDTSVSMK